MPAKPKRLLPTKPGWWWASDCGVPCCVYIFTWDKDGNPLEEIHGQKVSTDHYEWLGEVNPEPLKD